MISLDPKNYFCAVALLLSFVLHNGCASARIYTPSYSPLPLQRYISKPVWENTRSERCIEETKSQKALYYSQAQSGYIQSRPQTEKYAILISLVVAIATAVVSIAAAIVTIATLLVRLNSKTCKEFNKIEHQNQEIKTQKKRINKLEKNSEHNREILLGKMDELRKRLDSHIEDENREIDFLRQQVDNNHQKQIYELKSGTT